MMTERIVFIITEDSINLTCGVVSFDATTSVRQVSVPWCKTHRSPDTSGTDEFLLCDLAGWVVDRGQEPDECHFEEPEQHWEDVNG